jgi:streptomycin 6-kinase
VKALGPRPCFGDPAIDAADWAMVPLTHGGGLGEGVSALASAMPELDSERLTAWCRSLAVLLAIQQLRRHGRNPHVETLLDLAP